MKMKGEEIWFGIFWRLGGLSDEVKVRHEVQASNLGGEHSERGKVGGNKDGS